MKRNSAPRNKRRLTRIKGPGEVRSTVACAWSLGMLMMKCAKTATLLPNDAKYMAVRYLFANPDRFGCVYFWLKLNILPTALSVSHFIYHVGIRKRIFIAFLV